MYECLIYDYYRPWHWLVSDECVFFYFFDGWAWRFPRHAHATIWYSTRLKYLMILSIGILNTNSVPQSYRCLHVDKMALKVYIGVTSFPRRSVYWCFLDDFPFRNKSGFRMTIHVMPRRALRLPELAFLVLMLLVMVTRVYKLLDDFFVTAQTPPNIWRY